MYTAGAHEGGQLEVGGEGGEGDREGQENGGGGGDEAGVGAEGEGETGRDTGGATEGVGAKVCSASMGSEGGEGGEEGGKKRECTAQYSSDEQKVTPGKGTIEASADPGLKLRSGSILDLLRKVAPKMMARADANWGYGVASNLDDPKYNHPKHWSNPLETK